MQRHASDLNRQRAGHALTGIRRIQGLLALALVAMAAAFWGCGDNAGAPVTPNPTGTGLQPLAVGSSWSFIDSSFGPSSVTASNVTIKVGAKSNLVFQNSNREVYVWEVFDGANLRERNLIRNETDGLWHYAWIDALNNDSLIVRKMWAKYPVSRGDEFKEDRYAYDPIQRKYTKTATWTWSCLSTTQQIQVGPGVTKTGIVYWTQADSITEHRIFYVPEIGYAGWETKVSQRVTFRETLVGYQLK
jgi:hypothetical protein